jgi:hypothetical protein
LIIYIKIMIKCIKLTLECQRREFDRDRGRERRERKDIRNVRKERIKKQFVYFNRLGATEQEKRKNLECHVVSTSNQKNKN